MPVCVTIEFGIAIHQLARSGRTETTQREPPIPLGRQFSGIPDAGARRPGNRLQPGRSGFNSHRRFCLPTFNAFSVAFFLCIPVDGEFSTHFFVISAIFELSCLRALLTSSSPIWQGAGSGLSWCW